MNKLLLFVLILIAIYLVRRSLRPSTPTPRDTAAAGAGKVERMVACAQCGLHVPEGEALEADGQHFCCEAHQRIHRGQA